ncbi:DUF2157 domain-containing protein [Sphaerisporangium sp. TRM90804]|uniref:DUF2157 domain-containing protein n=1 Tax=Sphaerisporangium sp. TRM90804 TaxID=3031113 RepID=UPI00244BD3D2|nr:DUF2157 domain-containing protein [Sphaerisporangium sp. TRM90804]MDH2423865.1 DUF2157 domain-containing protein [Sphaerisporangium sp. TRM90804]
MDAGRHDPVRVPARRLAWLRAELARWQAEGVIDAETAERIAGRYAAGRRVSLERLVLLLGGGFLGVGLIWLVSANLDRLPPLTRFAGVVLVWLAAAAAGEVLRSPARAEAARLVTVLAAGGVVFQAAQSLQVPAYASSLLGVWAAGTLAYAYATAAVGPLLAGVALASVWYGWYVGEQGSRAAAVAVSLVVAGVVATSAAVLHERRWRPGFAPAWRLAGIVLALAGLFVAAFPGVAAGDMYGSPALWTGLGAAALAAGAAAALGGAAGRREVVPVVLMVGAALLLAAWAPGDGARYAAGPDAAQTLRALAGTLVYILAAVWFAAVAARRDLPALVYLATAALVVFVTVQSFAVFQPLLSGAALFLALGVVFLVTGVLVDRGRRRLMEVAR